MIPNGPKAAPPPDLRPLTAGEAAQINQIEAEEKTTRAELKRIDSEIDLHARVVEALRGHKSCLLKELALTTLVAQILNQKLGITKIDDLATIDGRMYVRVKELPPAASAERAPETPSPAVTELGAVDLANVTVIHTKAGQA